MAFHYSPKIITDGLEFYVDASNSKSYVSGSTTEYDLVGSQDMTLNNGVSYTSDNLGSLVFDGSDDFTQSSEFYPRTERMSFDVWFMRTGDVGSTNMIWNQYFPYLAFRGAAAGVNADKFLFSFFTVLSSVATQQVLYSQGTYLDNVWYNVCCTLDTNITTGNVEAKMYINGELDNTLSLSSVVDEVYSSPRYLRLSKWTDAQVFPFEGKIPSLKVYNKILSADEVRQNYNATKTRFGL
jgi:hypothetical protein